MEKERIEIGKYTLKKMRNGHIWIEQDDGEAGEFNTDELEKVIKEFYDKNF